MNAAKLLFSALLAAQVVMLPGMCAAATGNERAAVREVPAIKKDCAVCHESHDGKSSILLLKPIEALCIECHRDRTSAGEHRVNVAPTMNVRNLPLSSGKMTCITCHDPHKNRYGNMLRMPKRNLCLQCHPV